jgi:C_GCAxxG_C_C family probable redox protein
MTIQESSNCGIMSKQSIAIDAFRGGYNCSQSVIAAYAEQLKIDKATALSIACGFGAGMGRLQETCGAVTGSYMVLGVFACQKYAENAERKDQSYLLIQEFTRQFIALHGSDKCRDLVHYNLLTPEGRREASEQKVFASVCEKCITDSIEIMEGLISVK